MNSYNASQFLKITLSLALGVTLTACSTMEQSVKTAAVPVELPAMDRPDDHAVGAEFHWITNGEKLTSKVIAVEDGVSTIQLEDGCEWKHLGWDWAPVLEINNCYGRSESSQIRKSEGSPWPMQTGKKWSHSYTRFQDSGKTTRLTYRCEVNTAEIVSIPAGEFRAFKIICKDRSSTKTYWFTPDHAAGVVKSTNKTGTNTSMSDLVKMIPAQ